MKVIQETVASATNSASGAKYFAQALLARSHYADRLPEKRLPKSQPSTPEAIRSAEYLAWLMSISESRSIVYRRIAMDRASEVTRHGESLPLFSVLEGDWDPAKHPRRGGPPNAGWFATSGGGSVGRSSANGTAAKQSTLNRILDRNREFSNLAGSRSSATIRAANLAAELQSAPKLPREMATAFASGLKTGGKAVINGGATSVKNVVTLGLSSSQLELIGVTDEDRALGYDTAVTIATASGELLIAAGTAGMSSALSKGGSIARGASGALVAYDSAGNAVGVVQGSYDAATDGVSIRNGAQITAGALGLTANVRAAANVVKTKPPKTQPVPQASPAEVAAFVEKLPRKATPTHSAASQYEIKHTGPHNYTVSGGGEKFDIDGFQGTTLLEAKYVGNPKSSPYVPGSSCYGPVRQDVLDGARDELRRLKAIIDSGDTPFDSVKIITNSPEAKRLFEDLLKEASLPGSVRLED